VEPLSREENLVTPQKFLEICCRYFPVKLPSTLQLLIFCGHLSATSRKHVGSKSTAATEETAMTIQAEIVRLRKLGFLVETIGKVTNHTNSPIQGAWAVVSYFNGRGELIQTDRAPVKRSTLLPGQTSRFRAISPWNPDIVRGTIRVTEPSEYVAKHQEC
jgi:hypothetical protein